MALRIQLHTQGNLPAATQRVRSLLTDRRQLHEVMGARVGDLTKRYIIEEAAPSRHKTADRLGAAYTSYLSIAGQSVTSSSGAVGASVVINQNGSIFARVNGPVLVRPVTKNWLTIPAHKSTYATRAREHGELQFWRTRNGAMLVKRPKYERKADGKRRTSAEAAAYRAQLDAQTTVMFWLVKQARLPRDRELLPSDRQYGLAIKAAIEEAAQLELGQL
jgi:hypothetical protein